MDWFKEFTLSDYGAVASILGLLVVVITLFRVGSLRKAVSVQAIRRAVSSLFDEIDRIPPSKGRLTNSQANNVEQLLIYSEMFFVTRTPFRQLAAKRLIKKMKTELKADRNADNVKRDARLLRDQIFVITGA